MLVKIPHLIYHSSSPLNVFFLWPYGNELSHLLNTCEVNVQYEFSLSLSPIFVLKSKSK